MSVDRLPLLVLSLLAVLGIVALAADWGYLGQKMFWAVMTTVLVLLGFIVGYVVVRGEA